MCVYENSYFILQILELNKSIGYYSTLFAYYQCNKLLETTNSRLFLTYGPCVN